MAFGGAAIHFAASNKSVGPDQLGRSRLQSPWLPTFAGAVISPAARARLGCDCAVMCAKLRDYFFLSVLTEAGFGKFGSTTSCQ
jgi:hypothetical protein